MIWAFFWYFYQKPTCRGCGNIAFFRFYSQGAECSYVCVPSDRDRSYGPRGGGGEGGASAGGGSRARFNEQVKLVVPDGKLLNNW